MAVPGTVWNVFAWSGADPPRPQAGFRLLLSAILIGIGVGLACLVSPGLAIVLVFGAVICVVALSKPVVLCYLVVAATVLPAGIARGRLIPVLKLNEATLLFSAGLAFLLVVSNRRSPVPRSKYALIAFPILFLGTTIIPGMAYFLRGVPLTSQDIFFLLAPLQYLPLFWLFRVLPRTEADRQGIMVWMLICGSIVAVIGLLQAGHVGFVVRFLNQWYPSTHLDAAVAAGRITSLMAGWNLLGVFMMVNLLIAWAFLPFGLGPLGRFGLVVPVVLCAACLAASGSFAGIIGLVTGVTVITLLVRLDSRRVTMMVAVLAIAAVGILVLQPVIRPLAQQRLAHQFSGEGIVPQTLLFRFHVWREVFWPIIQQNPLWGTSLSIPASFTWQWAESQYVLLLFRFGIVGLVGWLVWLGATLVWLARRLGRGSVRSRLVTVSVFATVVVLAIIALTNEVFEFFGFADYLWIMLALADNNGGEIAVQGVLHS